MIVCRYIRKDQLLYLNSERIPTVKKTSTSHGRAPGGQYRQAPLVGAGKQMTGRAPEESLQAEEQAGWGSETV